MRKQQDPGAGQSAGARTTRSNKQKSPVNIEAAPPAQVSPVFVLRVRFVRGGNDVSRLRAILKSLLRHWGLRCVSIVEEAWR